MNDKIEIGEYVRTREGYIGILIDINMESWNYLTIDCKRRVRIDFLYPDSYLYLKDENIAKHSSNIIDLIEVGDYVNGVRILDITGDYIHTTEFDCSKSRLETIIKSIVTKEQLAQVQYEV